MEVFQKIRYSAVLSLRCASLLTPPAHGSLGERASAARGGLAEQERDGRCHFDCVSASETPGTRPAVAGRASLSHPHSHDIYPLSLSLLLVQAATTGRDNVAPVLTALLLLWVFGYFTTTGPEEHGTGHFQYSSAFPAESCSFQKDLILEPFKGPLTHKICEILYKLAHFLIIF